MSSFSSTNIPKSVSTGLLSIGSSLSLYLCLEFPQSKHRTLNSAFLNVMKFTQAHLSSLSLWMAPLLSNVWTTPHNLCYHVNKKRKSLCWNNRCHSGLGRGGKRHIFSGTQTSKSVSSCTQHGKAACAPSAANVPPSLAHKDQVLPQPTCFEHCSAISKAQHEVLEQQHYPESERGNSVYAVKMEIAKGVVSS